MKINFKCPICKKSVIEEILLNVTQASIITDIDQDSESGSVYLDYGLSSNEGGELSCFQCLECGYVIPACDSPEALLKWLRENNMIIEENND